MASQRIVLTSPWKLGLFVFLLVVGTGFGLIYAYLELFDGQIDLSNEEHLRAGYIVLGAVAALGILGYLACVTAARPLDRVVKGGKQREKIMKKLAKVSDPTEVDLDEFEEEPAVMDVIERWAEDVRAAQDTRSAMAQQRQALNNLATQVSTAGGHGVSLDPEESSPELDPLVEAINVFAREAVQGAETQAPAAAAPVDEIRGVVEHLSQHHAEMQGFVESIASNTAQMSQRGAGGAGAPPEAIALVERSAQRVEDLRVTLESLAEETNKLAITAALQISRLGDGGSELLETAEEMRRLSTQYQRLSSDLRLCETDQQESLKHLRGASARDASGSVDALAMVLDQNTEAMREVFAKLVGPMQQLAQHTGAQLAAASRREADKPVSRAHPIASPSNPASAPQAGAPQASAPQAAPELAAEAADGERIFDMEELGGVEIASGPNAPVEAAAGSSESVFELEQFGAVELS